jgi:hypothetical protein
MRLRKILSAGIFAMIMLPYFPVSAAAASCESGHWVEAIMDDGSIVKLEDGTLWRVSAVDTIDSALWLPNTAIVACDGKLINTDDNETVEATKIK